MAKNTVAHRTPNFSDMTPFNFFEDFGRHFFEDLQDNLVKTDIHENDNAYIVEAEIPGIPKENIHVHYENGLLTIAGTHEDDHETKDKQGHLIRSERAFNNVRRQFAFDNIKEKDIKASYHDGVLKVELPKLAEKEQKHLSIPIK